MCKRLVFIRHCTTSWNRLGRIQGKTDIPLDAGGVEEARALAHDLKHLGIGRILSSDLRRAAETAEIVGETLGLPVVFDSRLREMNFGKLEGMTRDEIIAAYGEAAKEHFEKSPTAYDLRAIGGEDHASVVHRHMSVVYDEQKNASDVTLLVGHGRGLNTLLGALSEEPTLERNQVRIVELPTSIR